MKLKLTSRNFVVQVIGLLLLWCLAIYTIYQIRSVSFETINIPGPKFNYHVVIYQPKEETKLPLSNTFKNLDSLPIDYWTKNEEKLRLNRFCAAFPNPLSVEFYQTYWQTLPTTNGSIYILNAYLDTRAENSEVATVRILTMVESGTTDPAIYCQLWFEEQAQPVVTKTSNGTKLWNREHKEALPYLINCPLPADYYNRVPVAISLVEKPCNNPINILKVNYNRYETTKNFGVCVKGLDAPHKDFSDTLIEWVELLSILGAKSLFFYDINLHPNVRKVLNYYKNERKTKVANLALVEGSYELTNMQREVIPYTDCLYKHMYEFKYILILDIDEVLLPLKTTSWKELLPVENVSAAFYNTQSVYFVDTSSNQQIHNIPAFFSMLQNIYRKKDSEKLSVHTFFNTQKVLTLHNDMPVTCLKDCISENINEDNAQLQHYHKDCFLENIKGCFDFKNGTIVDNHIWKFKETLMENVMATRKYVIQ